MSKVEIQVLDNGPCVVKGGDIALHDGEGNTFDLEGKPVIALCRCGMSANKPFCDGAHAREGFDSKVQAS